MSISNIFSDLSGVFLTERIPLEIYVYEDLLEFVTSHCTEELEDVDPATILRLIFDVSELVHDMQESEALGA